MNPETIVQEQLGAYNARDLERFVATCATDVELFRRPLAAPSLVGVADLGEFYRTQRFNRPALHADLVNRIVIGNKVIDHERISGVHDAPFEAAVAYEVVAGRIRRVWSFLADPAVRAAEPAQVAHPVEPIE